MSVKDRISDDMKTAMKAKDKDRLSVLRMLLSEIKYAQASVNVHQDLPEDEVVKVITSYHKRLTKSLEDFPEGERREAVRNEIVIVNDYLPKKASEDDVRKVVDQVLGATADRTFGPLMKEVMAKLGSAGDGKVVSAVLKQRLG